MTTEITQMNTRIGDLLEYEALEFFGVDLFRTGLKVITRMANDHCEAILAGDADGVVLMWHDFVINAWQEEYDSLPVGLMRLASLLEATERDALFVLDPEQFTYVAGGFLSGTAAVSE